jgi:hypothetical protein
MGRRFSRSVYRSREDRGEELSQRREERNMAIQI